VGPYTRCVPRWCRWCRVLNRALAIPNSCACRNSVVIGDWILSLKGTTWWNQRPFAVGNNSVLLFFCFRNRMMGVRTVWFDERAEIARQRAEIARQQAKIAWQRADNRKSLIVIVVVVAVAVAVSLPVPLLLLPFRCRCRGNGNCRCCRRCRCCL